MKKTVKTNEGISTQGRVLARCLAEDLRHIQAGVIGDIMMSATSTATFPDGGRKDITNVGGDGDLMEM